MGNPRFESEPSANGNDSPESPPNNLDKRIETSQEVFNDLEDDAWIVTTYTEEANEENEDLAQRWSDNYARWPKEPEEGETIIAFNKERIRVQALSVKDSNVRIAENLSEAEVGSASAILAEAVYFARENFADWRVVGREPSDDGDDTETNAGTVLFARPSFNELIESGKIDRIPGVSFESEPGYMNRDVLPAGRLKVSCEPLPIDSPRLSRVAEVYDRVDKPSAAVTIRALQTNKEEDPFDPDDIKNSMPDMTDPSTRQNITKIMHQLDSLGYDTILIDHDHDFDVADNENLAFSKSLGNDQPAEAELAVEDMERRNTKGNVREIISRLEQPS